MPTADQLQQMADWLAGTDIGLLELRTPQGTVRMGRDASPEDGSAALDPSEGHGATTGFATRSDPILATASSVGVFLHGHPLDGEPCSRIGERVLEGQPLGLLQIGPLLLPVASPRAGQVSAVPMQSGRTVGYGEALVALRAD